MNIFDKNKVCMDDAAQGCTDHSKFFILCDGKPLRSLLELADSFEDMSDDVFNHHVNPGKNDFEVWVRDVFGERELAEKLARTSSKNRHQVFILRHLVRMMG
ncbi:hypothetical protein KY320_03985 [Candidatus Woesearchaeota archaeon]|nr:hypothetical protein [Candidatus Woesearchaeota archaeon]